MVLIKRTTDEERQSQLPPRELPVSKVVAPSASVTGVRSRDFFLIVFSVLLYLPILAQVPQTQITDPHKVFIKFKEGAQLVKLAREPREQVSKSNAEQQASELSTLQATMGIVRLRAVKPDATRERSPGGIERLFIASLAEGIDPTVALDALRAVDQIEYAEPVLMTGSEDVPIQLVGQREAKGESWTIPNDFYFSSQWDLRNTGQFDGVQYGKVGADLKCTAGVEHYQR